MTYTFSSPYLLQLANPTKTPHPHVQLFASTVTFQDEGGGAPLSSQLHMLLKLSAQPTTNRLYSALACDEETGPASSDHQRECPCAPPLSSQAFSCSPAWVETTIFFFFLPLRPLYPCFPQPPYQTLVSVGTVIIPLPAEPCNDARAPRVASRSRRRAGCRQLLFCIT